MYSCGMENTSDYSCEWENIPDYPCEWENTPDNIPSKAIFSKLRVRGNKIVNEQDETIVPWGVSIVDPYFLKEIYNRLNEEDFKILSQDWKTTIVRVPIYPDLWDSNYLSKYVDPIIEWGERYEMYILILGYLRGF